MARERLTGPDRRRAILDAAGDVFGAKGFEATRMDDVARAAGIAKGLLYKHFASKDALFDALVDRRGEEYVAELRRLLAGQDVADRPLEATYEGLALWLRQFSSDPGTFQLTDPGSHRAYDRLRDRMQAVIAEAIRAAAPTVDPGDEWLAAAAVQGAAEALAIAWRNRRDEITEEQARQVLTTFCWGGLTHLQARVAGAAPAESPTS